MKHYKVVHVQRQNYPVAYLSYDTKTQQFSLRIRKDVKLSSLPGMMRLFAQKGLYEPGEEWSKRWVQERIVVRTTNSPPGIVILKCEITGFIILFPSVSLRWYT